MLLVSLALISGMIPSSLASAYTPVSTRMYTLPASEECMKGRGNCVIYAKSAQTETGRIVVGWEKATGAPGSGTAVGEVLPVWASDDNGDTW